MCQKKAGFPLTGVTMEIYMSTEDCYPFNQFIPTDGVSSNHAKGEVYNSMW
jgi:hypothetical protein